MALKKIEAGCWTPLYDLTFKEALAVVAAYLYVTDASSEVDAGKLALAEYIVFQQETSSLYAYDQPPQEGKELPATEVLKLLQPLSRQ